MTRTLNLSAAAVLALAACSSEPTTSTPEPMPDPPAQEITWAEHISPLVDKHCAGCHSADGIAPFALETYDDIKFFAQSAQLYIEMRLMPPFGMNNSGSCNTFHEARWLSEEEIEMFGTWVREGTKEGDRSKIVRAVPQVKTLVGDVFTTTMPVEYTPVPKAGETDDYRCFLLDNPRTENAYITGFEIMPGNEAIVHHALVFTTDLAAGGFGGGGGGSTNGEAIAAIDGADGRPGWECFFGAGEGVSTSGLPVVWTPGTTVVHYPEGTGLALPAGHKIILQVHYNTSGGSGSDRTGIRFSTVPNVARPAAVVLSDGLIETMFDGTGFALPEGSRGVEFTWSLPFEEAAGRDMGGPPGMMGDDDDEPLPSRVDVYGAFPHMHELGRKLKARHTGNGRDECATDVFAYDYHWQQMYFFDEPISMLPGEQFDVTCTFDTTSRNEPVRPGFGSFEEMCSFILYVVPVP